MACSASCVGWGLIFLHHGNPAPIIQENLSIAREGVASKIYALNSLGGCFRRIF
jgi:hypothetical protein